MLLTIKPSHEMVKAGQYQCKFLGIEPTETSKGAAFRWKFATDNGQEITGLSDTISTTKNRVGKWLAALSGKPQAADVAVSTDDYVGKRYLVIVSPYNDTTRIETFVSLAV